MTEMYNKPLPQPSIDSKPFWDGLKDRRVMLQTCGDCGLIRHYPRPVCDACYSMDVEWTEASGRGTVYSWTQTHHPFHDGFRGEVPYILVTVDLAEGVRIQSQLIDAKFEDVRVGLPVEVVFVDATDEVTLPLFRIAK
ncbi:MAG: Zn-ribbon domain-containing OB-fold protein [Alphaproteobacteria bacterium]|jgi:uncharacterized OB-fold protein